MTFVDQFFGVYTTSRRYDFVEFPNFVGNFELGFAWFDDEEPLGIFGETGLAEAVFDASEVVSGSGHLSSRRWDEDRDIVDGYYISFEIDEVSVSSLPAVQLVTP